MARRARANIQTHDQVMVGKLGLKPRSVGPSLERRRDLLLLLAACKGLFWAVLIFFEQRLALLGLIVLANHLESLII